MKDHHDNWSLSFCTQCKKDILEDLKESVYVKLINNTCDSYSHDHAQVHYVNIQLLEGWCNYERNLWKFTNSARRKIIRVISVDA